MKKLVAVASLILALGSWAAAADKPDSSIVGWRGNWTGRFPDATPVTNWSIKPDSPVADLKYQAARPAKDDNGANARDVWGGDVAHWLTLTGFNAKDPRTALDEAFVPDEAALQPAEGDKVVGQEWKLEEQLDYKDGFTPERIRKNHGGPYSLGFSTRFYVLEGKGANTVGYAHTYLFAQSSGKIAMQVSHEDGMKVWVNGKEVYKTDKAFRNFHHYEVDHSLRDLTVPTPAPRFDVELQKGWNRVLLKLARKEDAARYTVRFVAPADVKYKTTNVRWISPMPAWSNSTPIVVGDKIFVTSEPDELVCVNRADGKILWRRPNTLYDATPEPERAKNPIFKEIAPLAAELAKGVDANRGTVLRHQITALLKKVDPEMYNWTSDAHIPAIGYTCPTPVSDGKFVYAFLTPGVAVCYDLNGNRQWIQNVMDLGLAKTKGGKWHHPTPNSASPALIGDKFILFKGWFRAFDKMTGKLAWDTGNVTTEFDGSHGNIPFYYSPQSVVPFRLDGTDMVMGFWGRTLRASDGKVMSGPVTTPHVYNTAVIDGDIAYIWGAEKVQMKLEGDKVEIKKLGHIEGTHQFTVSSPLLHDGLIYAMDSHGEVVVIDANTLKQVYRKKLDMWPLFHFNAIGATPSVALGGKHIYLIDNQGVCVVIEPGRTFKQVAYNRIDTMMQHPWPLTTRERIEASPVFDGQDLFIRGEKNLYCIGKAAP
jgi:outer membrane protein assembly factor BamB